MPLNPFKMKKLNEFEKHCIKQAVKLYLKEIDRELDEMKKSGKRPIYTIEFFPSVFKDIFNKLKIDVKDDN